MELLFILWYLIGLRLAYHFVKYCSTDSFGIIEYIGLFVFGLNGLFNLMIPESRKGAAKDLKWLWYKLPWTGEQPPDIVHMHYYYNRPTIYEDIEGNQYTHENGEFIPYVPDITLSKKYKFTETIKENLPKGVVLKNNPDGTYPIKITTNRFSFIADQFSGYCGSLSISQVSCMDGHQKQMTEFIKWLIKYRGYPAMLHVTTLYRKKLFLTDEWKEIHREVNPNSNNECGYYQLKIR